MSEGIKLRATPVLHCQQNLSCDLLVVRGDEFDDKSNTRVIQEPSDGKKLIKVKVKFFLSATFCHFSPDQIIQNTAQKSDDGMF